MKVKFMQEGGAVAAPAPEEQMAPQGAPQETPQGGDDQMMQQLVGIAESIIQQLGPEAAGAVAEIILQMLQGGGQPMLAPEAQPAFQRRGGRLQRIH